MKSISDYLKLPKIDGQEQKKIIFGFLVGSLTALAFCFISKQILSKKRRTVDEVYYKRVGENQTLQQIAKDFGERILGSKQVRALYINSEMKKLSQYLNIIMLQISLRRKPEKTHVDQFKLMIQEPQIFKTLYVQQLCQVMEEQGLQEKDIQLMMHNLNYLKLFE